MNFIAQGFKGQNHWWRYGISLSILLFPFVLNIAVYYFMPEIFDQLYEDLKNFDGDKNILLIENLLPFAFLLLILLFFVKYLHNRPITSVVTSRPKIDWSRFFFGVVVWGIVSVALLVIGYLLLPNAFIWNFKPMPFLFLVVVSLVLIPLQTSFEELFFRGYLMQCLGTLSKNRWVPLVITSVFFGSMHAFNPEVEKMGAFILVFYIATGFLFGMVTLLDEGLEIALGMHAINNIIAAVFITSDWSVFQTDALFVDTSEPTIGYTVLLPVLVVYPLVLVLLQRKYQWTNWKTQLTGKIYKPTQIEP